MLGTILAEHRDLVRRFGTTIYSLDVHIALAFWLYLTTKGSISVMKFTDSKEVLWVYPGIALRYIPGSLLSELGLKDFKIIFRHCATLHSGFC